YLTYTVVEEHHSLHLRRHHQPSHSHHHHYNILEPLHRHGAPVVQHRLIHCPQALFPRHLRQRPHQVLQLNKKTPACFCRSEAVKKWEAKRVYLCSTMESKLGNPDEANSNLENSEHRLGLEAVVRDP
ncbi:hypothetical protein DVH24_023363, partial [Malus domestica]